MTTNQVNYHANQIKLKEAKENARANLAKERENLRSNLAKEAENYRSNKAKEEETKRSNLEKEAVNRALAEESIRDTSYARKMRKWDRIEGALKGFLNSFTPGGIINASNKSYGLPTSEDINPQLGRLASAYAKMA